MSAQELRRWLMAIFFTLVVISFQATVIALYLHSLGEPTIVRQCITIDAPKGTTKVGCDP